MAVTGGVRKNEVEFQGVVKNEVEFQGDMTSENGYLQQGVTSYNARNMRYRVKLVP